MQPIPIVSAFPLLFSWWNSRSIRFKSGDWLGQSKTFHFFALINTLTELAGCFGSLSWCNMKHFPMNLVAFSWILVGKMVLYPSRFILLLSSYIKSSVKLRGPVPETACMPMPWHHLHHALQMRLYAWDHLQFPFFSTFLLSHHLDKGSSLSHRSINTVPKLFWLTFVLFANSNLAFLFLVLVRGLHIAVILCQSHLRTVDCQSISFLEVVGDFTDMSFRDHFHSFYDLSVINYCCFLSRSGRCWLLVVSKLLISPCPLFLIEL